MREPFFQGQGVHGQVVRRQGQAFVQRAGKTFGRIGGQARDQVHIDVGNAGGFGQLHGLVHVCGAVTAADGLQHGLFHGLGIDADAGDAVFRQHGQLFRRHGVGAACFYRVFTQADRSKCCARVRSRGLQLCGGQRGGRAAADVEGFDLQPQFRRCAAHQGDFAAQSFEIRPDHGKRFFYRCADKGAVGAAGGTKWDAHVQGKFILRSAALGFAAGPGGGQAQFCPIGGDKVFRTGAARASFSPMP